MRAGLIRGIAGSYAHSKLPIGARLCLICWCMLLAHCAFGGPAPALVPEDPASVCDTLPSAKTWGGFKVGGFVMGPAGVGQVREFRCVGGEPGAAVLRTDGSGYGVSMAKLSWLSAL